MKAWSGSRAVHQGRINPRGAFEPLAEALARIAFGSPLGQQALEAHLEQSQKARTAFEMAVTWLSAAGANGRVRLRGRYVRDFDCDEEAALADTADVPPERIEDFLQIDLDKWGLRRHPHSQNVVAGGYAKEAAYDRSFVTWASKDQAELTGKSDRLAEGYRGVQVSRDDLEQALRTSSPGPAMGRPPELDHDEIRSRARQMRAEQPNLSRASAAAAIAVELPLNTKTGRPRDARGLERIISPVWEGREDEVV